MTCSGKERRDPGPLLTYRVNFQQALPASPWDQLSTEVPGGPAGWRKEASSTSLPARSREKSAGQFFHMKIQASFVGHP